jgi:hypothetical protein
MHQFYSKIQAFALQMSISQQDRWTEINWEMELGQGRSIRVRIRALGSGSRSRQQGRGPRRGAEVGASVSGLSGGDVRVGRATEVRASGRAGGQPGEEHGWAGGWRRATDSEIWLGGARVGGGRRRATDSEIWLGRSTGGCAREIWLGTGRVSHIRA